MSKDGTARGGARRGAGRVGKAIKQKILEGTADVEELRSSRKKTGEKPPAVIPAMSDFMTAESDAGGELYAKEVFEMMWLHLRKMGVEDKVDHIIVEMYSMCVARWIQCEKAIAVKGLTGEHPTTKGATTSPYVAMGKEYLKQAMAIYYQLYTYIKDYSGGIGGEEDTMEDILSGNWR